MKNSNIFLISMVFGFAIGALAEGGFVQKSRLPLTWIKQASQDKWSLVNGVSGPHKVSVDLVNVKEEPQGRKLASTQEAVPVTYKVEYIKRDLQQVSDEDLKQNQLMVVITAP